MRRRFAGERGDSRAATQTRYDMASLVSSAKLATIRRLIASSSSNPFTWVTAAPVATIAPAIRLRRPSIARRASADSVGGGAERRRLGYETRGNMRSREATRDRQESDPSSRVKNKNRAQSCARALARRPRRARATAFFGRNDSRFWKDAFAGLAHSPRRTERPRAAPGLRLR